MSQLTAAAKRRITDDWKKPFPNLGVYKPMWLMKRHGPLLMGIILDRTRSNDVYVPKFHVHNLLWSSPFLVLSLAYRVPHDREPRMERQIRIDQHEARFSSAVDILKSLVPEITTSNITISRVLKMHHEFLEQKRDYALAKHCAGVFTDVVLLSFWAGHDDYALRCLDGATEIMQSWNSPALDLPSWRATIETQLDRSRMEAVVTEEIKKHKLSHLPVYELISDAPPEPSVVDVYKAVWG